MEITDEIKEKIERIFKDDDEMREGLLNADKNAIIKLRERAFTKIDPEIIADYCNEGRIVELGNLANKIIACRELFEMIMNPSQYKKIENDSGEER